MKSKKHTRLGNAPGSENLPVPASQTVVIPQGKQRMVQFTPGQQRIFNAGVLILGGAAAGGLLFLIGRKVYRNAVSNHEAGKGLDDSAPASTAKQLWLAMSNDGWFGTDEVMVRETLVNVPSKEFWNKVVKSYWKQYNRNLVDDLQGELSSTEFAEMKEIISLKPRTDKEALSPAATVSEAQLASWANRLHQAFNLTYWIWPYGTDEEAVYQVLKEVPDRKTMTLLNQSYQRQFTNTLDYDLRDEMSGGDLDKALQIINSKK